MARPIKRGLDYFPLDVNFFNDRAIKGLKGKYGADGITVYLYILCSVYGENGYYIKADDDFEDAIVGDLNMSYEKIGQIINFLCRRSLLDGKLSMSDKVLTSHGIQARFQEAVKARGAKNAVEVERKYWVLSESETQPYIKVTQNYDFSENNGSYSEKNPCYSENNATKESKVKKSKVKESKEEENSAAACFSEYEKYMGQLTPAVVEGIEYYIGQGMAVELVNRIIQYSCEQNKRSWQYINAVLLGNLKDGVKTLDDYNRKQAERLDRRADSTAVKKSKFNNYTDDNKPDYSNFGDKIVEDMLKGANEE